jgi:hypothetical protein
MLAWHQAKPMDYSPMAKVDLSSRDPNQQVVAPVRTALNS